MAYVTVPKDLDRIKNRVAFSLTLRQAVCLGIAGMVGVPAYFLTREGLGTSNASLAMVALMLPAFLFALYEKDGLPLEEVLMNIVKVKYLRPRERVFYRKAKPELAKERQADAAIPDGNNGLEEEDAVEDYEVSFTKPDRRDGDGYVTEEEQPISDDLILREINENLGNNRADETDAGMEAGQAIASSHEDYLESLLARMEGGGRSGHI